MPAAQPLLFPDPQPLVERLGRDFFRQLPAVPGVYLMRDASEAVLYVGKAKSLRQRLGQYRVANPDRLRGRHLRLLHAVARIEWRVCASEVEALAREAELLRALRPPFNRAGTWPGTPRYLAWRVVEGGLELAIVDEVQTGWDCHGPATGLGKVLRCVITRLVWRMLNQGQSVAMLPPGWFDGQIPDPVSMAPHRDFSGHAVCPGQRLVDLFTGDGHEFWGWAREALASATHPFEQAALAADLEVVADFAIRRGLRSAPRAIALVTTDGHG